MIHTEVVSNFVQDSTAYLLADALRVSMAVVFDGAPVNGNGLWQHRPGMALSGQRDTLIQAQEGVALFDPHAPEHLCVRFACHQYRQVCHPLMELKRD